MNRIGALILALSLASPSSSLASEVSFMDAAALAHALDRLTTTGRVLYIAAHPDDENTRFLAYLASARHLTVAYLSMTRGGGGQNLIGREQDELLDVIRTEELLAARALDGAEQRFTRMRDFGYSKTAKETLEIWGHDEALADVVWVIRTFQPDVVITRFDELPPNHGHHTASAILAREAFTAAADPQKFPEQLTRGATIWRADRLLNNVPQWREGPPPAGAIELDIGAYDPRLGLSYGELAALSRSQHKSQGFGVPGERGVLIERFLALAGTKPSRDILENLELSWARFGAPSGPLIKALVKARAELDRDHPERARFALLDARAALASLPDVPRVRDARAKLERLIAASIGLFARATAPQPIAVPGAEVPVKLEVVLRREASVQLGGAALQINRKNETTRAVKIPADAAISSPYWLAERVLAGRQVVRDPRLIGMPKGPPALEVPVELTIEGKPFRMSVPVLYSWTDRVHGERIREFLIAPPATVTPAREAIIFPNGQSARAVVRVRSGRDALRGEISLGLPAGWRSEPKSTPVQLEKAGDEESISFSITPPPGAKPAEIVPAITVDGKSWSYREDTIDYAHIPLQVVLQPVSLKLVPVALALPKGLVGYVAGPGDTVAEDLIHAGVAVTQLDDDTLQSGDLGKYSAIITGIRAYNTRAVLKSAHARLLRWVEKGGTLIVQYNTHSRFAPLAIPIGPYPLELGRGRITDETAEMIAVNPKHPLLNSPNHIGPEDFSGWVQERGLYYGEKWDPKYEPVFRAKDPEEPPLEGGMLTAKYGRGKYVYTGLAFFRQLPAGVPGAYRLFANLIAWR